MGDSEFLAAIRASQAAYEAREYERWARRDFATEERRAALRAEVVRAKAASTAAHALLTETEHRRMGMVHVRLLYGS